MNAEKKQIIEKINSFIQENKSELQDKKLLGIMNGIDIDNLRLIDVDLFTKETNSNSNSYNTYSIVWCNFETEEGKVSVEMDIYNDFGRVCPSMYYTIFYDSFNGVEVEVDEEVETKSHILADVLNEIEFSYHVAENQDIRIQTLIAIQAKENADKLNEHVKDIPGVKKILPNIYDFTMAIMQFENDLKIDVEIDKLYKGIYANK